MDVAGDLFTLGDEVIRLRSDDLTWRVVDGRVMVLDGREWSYLSVNEAGQRLWHLLVEGATADRMVAELTGYYDIDSDRARADVTRFVAGLRDHGLLESGA